MRDPGPSAAILSLGTALPPYRFSQETIANWLADSFPEQPGYGRWLRGVYAAARVETRHACMPDPGFPPGASRFAPGYLGDDAPGTAERMAIYQREAVSIGVAAGEAALTDLTGGAPIAPAAATITHLLVVSCTGFFAPGLDMAIARGLGLPATVERTLIGFMGCAAAFNGLRTAARIVAGQPAARVLVVSVELCSLHVQPGFDRESLIAGALFADGASACVVGAAPAPRRDAIALAGFHSEIAPGTSQEMVWTIGDHGFRLRLSPEIPRYLAEHAPQALATLTGDGPAPEFWAIHPGGPAIVERLAELFRPPPEDVAVSLAILRDYGNMSSATILFVLRALRERLRQRPAGPPIAGIAMAFGPGLVIEMARLAYLPASRHSSPPLTNAFTYVGA